MICLNCNKPIHNITFKSIFKESHQTICSNCYSEEIIYFQHETIPISNYEINIHSFLNNVKSNYICWMSFLKPWYLDYLNNYKEDVLLVFDSFDEDLFLILENINLGNIYIISVVNKRKVD